MLLHLKFFFPQLTNLFFFGGGVLNLSKMLRFLFLPVTSVHRLPVSDLTPNILLWTDLGLFPSHNVTLPYLSCTCFEKNVTVQKISQNCRGVPRHPSWMSAPGGSMVAKLGSSLGTKPLKSLEA